MLYRSLRLVLLGLQTRGGDLDHRAKEVSLCRCGQRFRPFESSRCGIDLFLAQKCASIEKVDNRKYCGIFPRDAGLKVAHHSLGLHGMAIFQSEICESEPAVEDGSFLPHVFSDRHRSFMIFPSPNQITLLQAD